MWSLVSVDDERMHTLRPTDDSLVVEAGKRGILIMLDQHRLDPERGISDLWCVG